MSKYMVVDDSVKYVDDISDLRSDGMGLIFIDRLRATCGEYLNLRNVEQGSFDRSLRGGILRKFIDDGAIVEIKPWHIFPLNFLIPSFSMFWRKRRSYREKLKKGIEKLVGCEKAEIRSEEENQRLVIKCLEDFAKEQAKAKTTKKPKKNISHNRRTK